MLLIYYIKYFLLILPDFQTQKYKIKESIISLFNKKYLIIIYYP